MFYLNLPYILSELCVCYIWIWCMFYLSFVYVLSKFVVFTIWVLCMFYLCLVYVLSEFGLYWMLNLLMVELRIIYNYIRCTCLFVTTSPPDAYLLRPPLSKSRMKEGNYLYFLQICIMVSYSSILQGMGPIIQRNLENE